jgi:hypothetical protein
MPTPSNLTKETAINISALAYSATFTPDDASQTLWFSYTGVTGRNAFGFYARATAVANYNPYMEAFQSDGTTPYFSGFGVTRRTLEVPDPGNGVTIYLTVSGDASSNPLGAGVEVTAVAEPALTGRIGDLAITDDQSPTEPLIILSKDDGTPRRLFSSRIPSEKGAVLSSSGAFLISHKGTQEDLKRYSGTGELQETISTTSATGQNNPPVTATATEWYVAQKLSGSPAASTVWNIAADGTVNGTTWTLPSATQSLQSIAVNPAETILYYVRSSLTGNAISRHDLTNDVDLGDIWTGETGLRPGDVQVLADGTIVFMLTSSPTGTVNRILQISTAGVVLNDWDFGTTSDTTAEDWFIDHFGVDVNGTDLVVWMQGGTADAIGLLTNFWRRLTIATGAIAVIGDTPQSDLGRGPLLDLAEVPTEYFFAPNSCPLLILQLAVEGEGEGEGAAEDGAPLICVHGSYNTSFPLEGSSRTAVRANGSVITAIAMKGSV